ncbi:cbb3-type cytochrome c oxidase subunit I [Oceanobacillus sp. CAU 1775]
MEATTTLRTKLDSVSGKRSEDSRITLTYFSIAFLTIIIGGFFGLLQVLNRAGYLELPAWLDYYQVLTAHGVLLVLVFSVLFVFGYFYAVLSHTTDGLLPIVRKMGWAALGIMLVAVVFVVTTILNGTASVMYTFYAPMQASPWFYVGLFILVVGIWTAAFSGFIQIAKWRKRNKGKHIPILAFFAMGVFTLMFFGSLGVTAEVLMLIPWAFGWTETINVMLSRTLFWSFGHTFVNIWYLTAVSVWYVVVPKIIGGRLFSDTLIRVVVILLVIANIPGGFHHQIVDPGMSEGVKLIHAGMSMVIGFPSLMTAYAMFYVFDRTGRKKGSKSIFGWVKKMPWGDVRFLAPMIAMIAFIPGGAGGIAQNANQLNQVVHNTLWVVGHFHLTVGVTAVLTFFGVVYWLIPYLSKRVLTPQMNRLGVIQTIFWAAGMLIMTTGMHSVGVLGSPRRTSYSTYGDNAVALSWDPYLVTLVIGGTLLAIGGVLMLYIVINLMFFAPKGHTEFPIGEVEDNASTTPLWTDRWSIWISIMILVIAFGYVFPIIEMIQHAPPGSPPFITW